VTAFVSASPDEPIMTVSGSLDEVRVPDPLVELPDENPDPQAVRPRVAVAARATNARPRRAVVRM
jgi:hypothetical protein